MGFEDFPDPMDAIGDALTHHGAPASVTDKILNLAGDLSLDDSHLSLTGALDQAFSFAPLPELKKGGTVMLVGLPGAGKTVTTDTIRAGGFQQLEAFTKILEIDLMSAGSPSELKDAMIAGIPGAGTIIDCAGGNPFDKKDLKRQRDLIQAVEAEVILLLADGTDPLEAADIAEIYRDLSASGLITTRIDVARRHGALLSAASAGELVIRGGGMGPSVTDGLKPLNPVALARLLLPDTEDAASDAGAATTRGSYV
jgi:flagellar biosynthesis protein FlhF